MAVLAAAVLGYLVADASVDVVQRRLAVLAAAVLGYVVAETSVDVVQRRSSRWLPQQRHSNNIFVLGVYTHTTMIVRAYC